ncbi:lamin tail domain-containing protein [Candidatus Zixiibacteriota bacterium]
MPKKQCNSLLTMAGGLLLGITNPLVAAPPQLEPAQIVINEVLVDPAADLDGDANGDGVRDTYQDEFIEIVNRGSTAVDISGWEMGPAGSVPFIFPEGTLLAPGEYAVVFGGGSPVSPPGLAFTAEGRIGSGLTNTGGRILLVHPASADTVQDILYGEWDTDSSWTRAPEGWGSFTEHPSVSGTLFSPGAPAVSGGGPGTGYPTVYRLRTVNLTSAGFQVAWRSGSAADGRIEVEIDGSIRHIYDRATAGVLHLAGIYGLDPGTDTRWRVISGGTAVPADSFLVQQTGGVSTSVPFTIYGSLISAGSGLGVPGAHVFLRTGGMTGRSGWLAAVSDSVGRWNLNLGNLRSPDGEPWSWGAGDTLFVDADGATAGVTTAEGFIAAASPQEITLPALQPDPAPSFAWEACPAGMAADSSIVLHYTLTDPGEAWARIYLRRGEEVERIPGITDPVILPKGEPGVVTVHLGHLPEGSIWWIGAEVEDGLNPPEHLEIANPLRISHQVDRSIDLVEGVDLVTPTLLDSLLLTAHDWLANLPGAGEMARWDVQTASWVSVSKFADGTLNGTDFILEPGIGYALVSAVSGSLQMRGPRRYTPPLIRPGAGLALVGITDSTSVRTATDILTDPAIIAVSRWNRYRQAWDGLFRLPDGRTAGMDFPLTWGKAVAIDVDTATVWQPALFSTRGSAGSHTISGRLSAVHPRVLTRDPGVLLAVQDGPGAAVICWAAPPSVTPILEREGGAVVWQASPDAGSGWQKVRVSGLAGGRYRAILRIPGHEGERRFLQDVVVPAGGLPEMPTWAWGPAPDGEDLLFLELGERLVPVSPAGDSGWFARLPHDLEPTIQNAESSALLAYAEDGGWTRWPLRVASGRASLSVFESGGPPLSVSGLETEEIGPLSVRLRWQMLHGEEPLILQTYFGYTSRQGGGGPVGDPRMWMPATEEITWEPGQPPACMINLTLATGPEGQHAPEAVAVRVIFGGQERWIGPAALSLPAEIEHFALLPAVPNPFNPETVLRYTLPAGGDHEISLEVRDVRGRLTRSLVDTRQPGGNWQIRWDGTDAAGARVAAGVYLVVLTVNGDRTSRKIILLK